MSSFILNNPEFYAHDTDFSGYLKKAKLDVMVDAVESTNFGSNGWKSFLGGLADVTLDAEGFWESTPDSSAFGSIGVPDRVVTVAPTGNEAETAYFFRRMNLKYNSFGQVGQMAPFTLEGKGSNQQAGIVRGFLASAKRTVSGTGAVGTAFQLGAVGANQFVYAALHVFSAGTTITMNVQSAVTNFATVTTRGQFIETTTGGFWLVRVAGPITDTWWRLQCSSITGSFSLAGAIGIGS